MSFLKKMQKKGQSKNHRELYFRASVPSATLECVEDKCLTDKEDSTKEESRKLSRPGSLKSFRKENRNGNVTSNIACSKGATTTASAAPRAPLSDVVGDHEKKRQGKVGADNKGDSPKKASCRRNKTRSGPTKVNKKAPPPPTSERPSVSHTSPSQSVPSRPIPVRPAPPPPRQPRLRKAAPPRPPPPTMKQPGKKGAKGPSIIKKKANEICKYPKDLNPFANFSNATDNDYPSQNSEKASRPSRQRHRRRPKNSKSEEYPMDKNPFTETNEMREKVSSARRQRLRRKRKESKSEEYPMKDNPSSDAEEMSEKPSRTHRQRRRRKRKASKSEEHSIKHKPLSDSDEGRSSSCSEWNETSDMSSISSLEDIQFVVNTATVEEVKAKSTQQGLATNNENEEQGGRTDSGDSKAQSFPSDKEISPDDVPSTNKDNSSASVGSTNLDASTAKDFTDVGSRRILKQAEPSEQANDMEQYQGGDGSASNSRNHCPELAIYLDAELQIVESELLSLQKVMVKLQSEMKEAMDTKDCEAEFESLSLDWLTLNKFRSELNKRKKDLIVLSKQENPKECLKFLREDLKCLVEVKSWKKTKEHRAQVKNVLDLILKLANMA